MPERLEVADLGRVHIIGIGGAGMSGIARVLLSRGVQVQGSDAKDSRRLSALRALGAQIWVGHAADHVDGADTVIFSTAIKPGNPEMRAARALGCRMLTRARALAAIMNGFRGVAVSGTHGKTTTTSMLTVALQQCGLDPSFVIGSELNEIGSNAHLGSGDIFVAEADESDGTFMQLGAQVGVVTNIEPDHLDHWGSVEAVERAFDEFALDIASRDGFVVACADDPGAMAMTRRARDGGVDVRTYGESSEADYRVEIIDEGASGWAFDLIRTGVRTGRVKLRVPGRHNVLNAAAALVCGVGLGASLLQLRQGLESFTGTRRRFEFRGEVDQVRVYDDYAHHPTEVRATLEAALQVKGDGRLVVAFQPHKYSRTAMFIDEFGQALAAADEVVLLEVYPAGEDLIPGASGQAVATAVELSGGRVVFEPSWSRVAERVVAAAQPGDMVMTVGAGDVSMLVPEILDALKRRARSRADASVLPSDRPV